MKVKQRVIGDSIILYNKEEDIYITIDIPSAEVLDINIVNVDIQTITKFMNRAKTQYNKFLNSKEIDDFMF